MFSQLPKSQPITIKFDDLTYSVPAPRHRGRLKNERKVILDGVSGVFRPGQLTAIMGPSGAGKSTLLNVLAGYRVRNVEGNITVNGCARNPQTFRKIQAYIMQDNFLLPYISADEAMMAAANLKLGPDFSHHARRQVVDDVLNTLGLSSCRNTRCHRLSGGQRKRLSIALELLNNPPVMFFDEPTSGLDSNSCSSCVSLLKTLADGGRTIICTIHQPSSRLFQQFDQLYILARGSCIYRGTRANLVPALAAAGLDCPGYHNPADFVMEAASGEYGDWVTTLVEASGNGKSLAWTASEERTELPAAGTCTATDETDFSPTTRADRSTKKDTDNGCGPLAQNSTPPQQNGAQSVVSPAPSSSHAGDQLPCTSFLLEQSSAAVCRKLDPDASGCRELDSDGDQCRRLDSNGDQCRRLDSVSDQYRRLDSGSDQCRRLDSDGDQCRRLDSGSDQCRRLDSGRELFRTSATTQFCVLFKRTCKSIVRDRMLTVVRLVSHLMFGLLIGSLYFRIGNEAKDVYSNAGQLFFALLFVLFSAMMPTILTFPLEMAVFKKEYMNCWYSVKSYYFAKTLADLPFQIVFPLIYDVIVYFMTSQPVELDRFCMFCLITVLTSLVAQSVGLVVGACCDIQLAVFLGPVTMIPIILFSGFFVNLDTIPVWLSWVSYLSYARYSFEGLMLSVYGFDREDMHCSLPYCHFKSPSKFLKELDMAESHYWIDVAVLSAMTVGLRLCGYFVLRWKLKNER